MKQPANGRLQIAMSKELMKALKKAAKKSKQSLSEYCRIAIACECNAPHLAEVRSVGRPSNQQ